MKMLNPCICTLFAIFIAHYSMGQDAATIMMNQQLNNQAGLLNIRNMERSFEAQNETGRRAISPAIKKPDTLLKQTSSLKINHDPQISKALRDQYISNISKTKGKDIAAKTDSFFGDIQTTFGKMITPFGLHQDNYADMLATYLIVMWMSVNKQTQLPSVTQVQAVRNQCLCAWTSGKINPLNDKQRQIVAETLMYQACSAVSIRQKAVSTSDSKLLDQLSVQTSALLSREGIILSNLALTNNGFIKK